MSRFVDVMGKRINMDTIAQYWRTRNDTICIEFTNGESENVPFSNFLLNQLDGEDFVVQIIPVTEPIYYVGRSALYIVQNLSCHAWRSVLYLPQTAPWLVVVMAPLRQLVEGCDARGLFLTSWLQRCQYRA